MTDRIELYEELLPLVQHCDPSGDAVRQKAYPHGADQRVWFFCPSHPDGKKSGRRSASLSPRYGVDCFAGCDFQSIVSGLRKYETAAQAADRAEKFRRPTDIRSKRPISDKPIERKTTREGKLAVEYPYVDDQGVVVAFKGRFEYPDGTKSFSWRLPTSQDWYGGLGGLKIADIPLYKADALAQAPVGSEVWFVEGEKAADAIIARGELATTHPGGAATRDFGPWVEKLLRGKNVKARWWADNDDVGREYMERFRLATLPYVDQKKSFSIKADVPHKGDAHDYLSAGGTLEKLREGVLTERVVQYLSDRAIRVSLPTSLGPLVFTFDEIEKGSRSLEAEITVQIDGPGRDPDELPYVQRLNLLSGSNVTDARRTLETIFGKMPKGDSDDGGWAKVLADAVALCRKAFAQIDRSRDASEAEAVEIEPSWFLEPYLHAGQFAIVFGDGETAKTMTLLRLAVCAALGEEFLPDLPVTQGPGLYGDWETNFDDWGRRVKRIVRGLGYPQMPPGLLHYWPGVGVSLADQVDAILEKCLRDRLSFFVCDSLGMASGSEPERAESAIRTANAVSRLTNSGITVIGVAHINRNDAKQRSSDRPFGSVFWNNAARRTIYVARSTSPDQDVAYQAWYPKKVNNGRKPNPLGVTLTFQGDAGPILFARDEVKRVAEFAASRDWKGKVKELLADAGALPQHEIASALGAEADSDKDAIRKMFDRDARSKRRTFVSFSREADKVTVWGLAV